MHTYERRKAQAKLFNTVEKQQALLAEIETAIGEAWLKVEDAQRKAEILDYALGDDETMYSAEEKVSKLRGYLHDAVSELEEASNAVEINIAEERYIAE